MHIKLVNKRLSIFEEISQLPSHDLGNVEKSKIRIQTMGLENSYKRIQQGLKRLEEIINVL